MFYTIYKITNKINGKFYIGKHKTTNLDDGYMGSGKMLKLAIKKHGIQNFAKEVLFNFNNEDDMNAKEAELVSETFCLREDTYNLCPGGQGGWSYVNANGLGGWSYVHANGLAPGKTRGFSGKKHSEATKEFFRNRKIFWGDKISTSRKGISPWNTGLQLSEQDRKNKSRAHKGEKNSQFGTMWITNGLENKKLNKEVSMPDGWRPGRV